MISTLTEENREEAAEYQRHGVTSAGMRLMWQILSAAAPQLPLLILGRLHLCSLFTVQCWGHEVNNGNNHTMICRVQRCEAIIAAASVPGAGLRPTEVCPSHGGSTCRLPRPDCPLPASRNQLNVVMLYLDIIYSIFTYSNKSIKIASGCQLKMNLF